MVRIRCRDGSVQASRILLMEVLIAVKIVMRSRLCCRLFLVPSIFVAVKIWFRQYFDAVIVWRCYDRMRPRFDAVKVWCGGWLISSNIWCRRCLMRSRFMMPSGFDAVICFFCRFRWCRQGLISPFFCFADILCVLGLMPSRFNAVKDWSSLECMASISDAVK